MNAVVSEPEVHKAALLFPPMTEEEFAGLKASIAERGQDVPCVMHEGKLLDGRNRWRACRELGIHPTCVDWNGEGSPTAYVVSLNLTRRHLNATQRALIAKEIEPMFAAEAKERQRNAGREFGESHPREVTQFSVEPLNAHAGEAAEQAAKAAGANRDYVRIAKKLESENPDLLDEVKAGTLSLPTAERKARARRGVVSPKKRYKPVSDEQMQPQKVAENVARLGLKGLAQHTHDFHAAMLRVQRQILTATESWTGDNRARLLAELRDINATIPGWISALSERDELDAAAG